MDSGQSIEKLEKENKRLKTINKILTVYVVFSLLIMCYNYFL